MTAIIIGRFQVPYLHLGHIYLISHAIQNYDRVIVLLGSCMVPDDKNPFSVNHRMGIIIKVFPQVGIEPLYDVPGNDKAWSEKVDIIIRNYDNPVLLHSRDSFVSHYTGRFGTREIPEIPGYSGTQLRKETT